MRIYNNTILTEEEIEALNEYTNGAYLQHNALMSSQLTNREKSGKIGISVPKNIEEFRQTLDEIICVYSAILKYYSSKGKNEIPKFIYRGARYEENGETFLSTTTNLERALDFCHKKSQYPILYKIQSEDVPYINIEEEGENEILFAPALIEESEELGILEEEKRKCDEIIIRTQKTNIKLKTIKIKPRDFSIQEEVKDLDSLCKQYPSYLENIKKLKNLNTDSLEYQTLVENIENYKNQIHNYLHSKFYEINKDILVQQNEHDTLKDNSSSFIQTSIESNFLFADTRITSITDTKINIKQQMKNKTNPKKEPEL